MKFVLFVFLFLFLPASAYAAFSAGDQVTISGTSTTYDGLSATVLINEPTRVLVDINETDSTGNLRRYAAANLKPKATPTPSPTSTPSPTPTATPTATPTPSPTPTPGPLTLTPVDGGKNYYSQYTNGLPTTSTYFPIGVWYESVDSQSVIDQDKDAGLNLYVGVACPECTDEATIRANNLKTLIQAHERTRFNDLGSENAGWLLGDEEDMCCGPPGFAGGNGYDHLTNANNGLPADGKARYANYGKGVMWWETDADAARFVNLPFQGLVSDDIYWFTDPNERTRPGYGVAASYGTTVDRMRFLDGMDGSRKPIWNFVEVGWPFTETASAGGRAIQPAELKAAVWHSIIAGARGIVYFNHSFGGPCQSQHVLRDTCGAAIRPAVKQVNTQVTSLAPVLNSDTVTGLVGTSANVRTLAKWDGTHFYVFAGNGSNSARAATFSLSCVGDATVTVVDEARTIPLQSGVFTDNFADGNAYHLYRIDGGSACGL